MPRSKHYYSAAEPSGGDEAKVDDDSSLLSLSLGDIYSSNDNAPATRAKAEADATVFRSPATTPVVVPVPVRPAADVLGAPFAAAAATAVHPPPLCFDAPVVQGGGGGGVVFPEATVPTLTQMAMVFPRDGNGVVPVPVVHGNDTAAAPIKRPAAKRLRTVRCRSSTTGQPSEAGSSAHAINTSSGDNNVRNEVPLKAEGDLHDCPPYQWSTIRVGVHHSLAELSRRGIETITGELQCKRCDDLKVVTLDIKAKFQDLYSYISCNIQGMDDRAPQRWREPALPDCEKCGQKNSMRPVISADKHKINWIFLLLSEMLGLCTLEQLKHFCANTQQHRTGAKDRVLYSTYMELCNQLLPNGLFDMASERQKRIRSIA
ncbi:hypothetical protein BAE44_0012125 [Dichanthelium oligosanthes]|uniref:DUF7086 domain-containing protein n=1 Tax=Dichanthelium oligosanthes TaxID=888268 RepID=A0A1E5VP39_9POAL|nr:hypothetical protein BAE44_0012125 [Dichanthelium oligosanthes]